MSRRYVLSEKDYAELRQRVREIALSARENKTTTQSRTPSSHFLDGYAAGWRDAAAFVENQITTERVSE